MYSHVAWCRKRLVSERQKDSKIHMAIKINVDTKKKIIVIEICGKVTKIKEEVNFGNILNGCD